MLFHRQLNYRFLRMVVSAVLISQLLGCGGGGNSSGGSTGGNLTSDAVVNVDLNGSVGDGPIIGATIDVYNDRGKMLSSVMSDVAAAYKINIKAKGNDYPLLLKVSGGTDLVTGDAPDFQLLSVALNPSEKSISINPFSTLVVKMAQSMGGVDAANVSAAKTIVTDSFAFGLDPSIVSDPITAQITESNIANIVKASEVLGEMVRRTRDALLTAGTTVSGDAVIAAIAADLVDGVLDGSGASGVYPTISAVAKVVSGQVLVEALSNSLKVGGVVATGVIDQSIAVTHGATSSQLSDSVRITSGMLDQTLIALTASQILDPGAALQNIVSVVGGISPNASPAEVVTVLPADASTRLDNVVTLAPYASTGEIAAINQVVVYMGSVDTTTDGTTTDGTMPPNLELIMDNGESGTSPDGVWMTSSGVNFYGVDSLYSNTVGGSYTFTALVSGSQEVSLWWTEYANRWTAVPIDIYDGAVLLDTVIVNQQQNGGAWNVLGSYQFSGQAHVVIRSVSTNTTSADAVRFVPVDISIPKITSTAVVVGSVGMAYSYDVDALSDPESGYQLLDGPVDMMIDPVTGIISWTPSAVGSYPVTVEASNSNGSDTQNFMIVVTSGGGTTTD